MSAAVPRSQAYLSTSVVVVGGLLGGFVVGRLTRRRSLGGAVFGAAGVLAGVQWLQNRGPVTAATLTGIYVGAMGLSHPLAKRIGAIPAVLVSGAAAGAAAYALHDRYLTAGLDPAERPAPGYTA